MPGPPLSRTQGAARVACWSPPRRWLPGEAAMNPTLARVTWPDFGVIVVVVSFVAFETTCLKLPVYEAAFTAVALVGSVVVFLLMPKTLVQLLRGLQELNTLLGGLTPATPLSLAAAGLPTAAAATDTGLPPAVATIETGPQPG